MSIRLTLNRGAVLAAIGTLAVCVADDQASAAVHAKKCAAHQSLLNGECVDNSFVSSDAQIPCSSGGACYRRSNHKHKVSKTNG